jgi:hypothetical protein
MLDRYSHIRTSAKQAAIATLGQRGGFDFEIDSPQKSPQSTSDNVQLRLVGRDNLLN